MDREQKAAAIAELTEELKEAEAVFAVDYRGISVTEAQELRGKLSEADAVFKVVKNRLAKRAAADAGTEALNELFVGPTALTLIRGDAVLAAKAISDFRKEHEVLEFKGGLMDGQTLDAEGFKQIARLPGADVLRGQLVGIAASPLTGLVRGLNSMLSGLAVALGQIAEQGLVGGDAPAAEPAAESEGAAEGKDAEGDAGDASGAQDESADDAPAAEAPAEQAAEDQEGGDGGDDAAEAEAETAADGSEEAEEAPAAEQASDEEESQPEEPAAEAEAEGSEE